MTPKKTVNTVNDVIKELNKAITAAAMHKKKITFLPSRQLEYLSPQNVEAKIATAVLTAVTVPICVPENPILLKYWPIRGQSTPIGAYVNTYAILNFLVLFNFSFFFCFFCMNISISNAFRVHNSIINYLEVHFVNRMY